MTTSSTDFDVVVIGGGAAGFYCAVNAARLYPKLNILLLEKTDKLLSKVKVSGGGRCNVTHHCTSIAEMVKNYPRGSAFLKKAFHQHFTKDTIQWFEDRKISLKVEVDGRMFPVTDTSQTIVDCLLNEARKHGVQIKTKSSVLKLAPITGGYVLHLQNGETITAKKICIAAGGHQTIEKFYWLNALNLQIEPPVPSLFTFNLQQKNLTTLMGISLPKVQVKIQGTKLETTGPVLITHWGLSGPAVLKLSALGARYLAEQRYEYNILVNWIPEFNETTAITALAAFAQANTSSKISNRNPFSLVGRFWEYFLSQVEVSDEKRYSEFTARERNKLAKLLCSHQLFVKGKTTFKDEFVTAGGISLNEINHQTMESKKYPGLFFAGEILDVDGVTGGFNFQNAWTTGYIAAVALGAWKCDFTKP